MANLLIAARNLTRNRRRLLTALLTVAVGVTCLVLARVSSSGFSGPCAKAPSVPIGPHSGHSARLPQRGRSQSLCLFTTGKVAAAPRDRILAWNQAGGTRLAVNGLISHGETTLSFVADGVDPQKEALLSKALHMWKGRILQAPR